ncbi:MAG TPA: hypothetical protein ENH41_01975 [Candidatus Omnitrophica bacterium]|nr:hypothetical protein [Candidatus Omnitrophota bacterium]
MKSRKIYLYNDNCSLNLSKLKAFIENTFKRPVIIKRIKNAVVTKGLLLDFIKTKKNIPEAKNSYPIIITKRLFATFDTFDKRIHLRSSLCSYPSIISLSGIVEAPAKPREYYLAKQSLSSTGLWEFEEPKIKEKLRGRFIDYDDKRILEILKGLVSQAIFFYLTGEPFCKVKKCRLYNAHWQEDLIYSQIKSGKFCAKHSKIL